LKNIDVGAILFHRVGGAPFSAYLCLKISRDSVILGKSLATNKNISNNIRHIKEIVMATSVDFIEYVCEQIANVGEVRYRKMFGEYMVYVNNKPILLVCDDVVYVKILDEIQELMLGADVGNPYDGAKLHYILDIDDREFSKKIIDILEPITPFPKPKKKSS
jgi:TfoX/Sxy family transcriptional regulator of competence genes